MRCIKKMEANIYISEGYKDFTVAARKIIENMIKMQKLTPIN